MHFFTAMTPAGGEGFVQEWKRRELRSKTIERCNDTAQDTQENKKENRPELLLWLSPHIHDEGRELRKEGWIWTSCRIGWDEDSGFPDLTFEGFQTITVKFDEASAKTGHSDRLTRRTDDQKDTVPRREEHHHKRWTSVQTPPATEATAFPFCFLLFSFVFCELPLKFTFPTTTTCQWLQHHQLLFHRLMHNQSNS